MPRRTPRRPSIGFCSWRRRTCVSRVVARSSTSPRSSASATWTLRSVRSGRNSCSGGSSSRMVTGRPSIASRISVKSWRWSGSSAARAASTPGVVLGDDELLDQLASLAEEHVLGAAQADALGAEAAGAGRVLGGVGIGAHPQAARAVGVGHDPRDRVGEVAVELLALEVAHHDGVGDRHGAGEHLAGRAVDGDDVALAEGLAAAHPDLLGLGVDVERLGAAHARTAHAAGDDGGVGGLAAAAGEDAAGGDHAAQVVGVGLLADQDHVLAARRPTRRRCRSRRRPCRPPRRGRRSCPWRAACARTSRRSAGTSAGRAGRR